MTLLRVSTTINYAMNEGLESFSEVEKPYNILDIVMRIRTIDPEVRTLEHQHLPSKGR